MRFPISLSLVSTLFLTSCAYEGIVVQKESRPHPLYHSLGIEGVYSFVLRDRASTLHRQMVTPEVFETYATGEYFNDLQPAPQHDRSYKGQRMMEPAAPMGPEASPILERVSSRSKASSPTQVAATAHSSAKARSSAMSVAKHTPTHQRTRTAQHTSRSHSSSSHKHAVAAKTSSSVAKKKAVAAHKKPAATKHVATHQPVTGLKMARVISQPAVASSTRSKQRHVTRRAGKQATKPATRSTALPKNASAPDEGDIISPRTR